MTRMQLPRSGRFAKVLVGWNASTKNFELVCYREAGGAAMEVSVHLGNLPRLTDLERTMSDLSLELPPAVRMYLAALPANDTSTLAHLKRDVADLLRL